MPFTVTMPKLSPTMEMGTIAKWLKKEGDFVHADEVLIEVATDKATVEYSALDEGWLRKILVKEGEEASINQAIAIFSIEKEESLESYSTAEPLSKNQKVEAKSTPDKETAEKENKSLGERISGGNDIKTYAQPLFQPEPPLTDYRFDYPTGKQIKIKASPLAKKIAREKGLDLTTVKGSGPDGRIISKDLDRAQPSGNIAFGHRELPNVQPGTYEEVPLSPVRKIIGQRLQESKSFIPHFYINQTIDAEPIVHLREQLKSQEIKVSVNDIVIKAVAMSLRQHPKVNSGYNSVNQTIILYQTIDLSFAVSTEGGLITPIIRHADYKNIGEISLEVRRLAEQARNGKLETTQYKGGSFTISNLGMYGVTQFQAILNPPQSAILAVASIHDVPIIKNQNVVPGKVLNLSLSVDHRVIDGVDAALFLKTLKNLLENPVVLLFN